MRPSQRATLSAAVVVTCFLTGGCGPSAIPSPAEVLALLNALILDPGTSCAELRDHYGLHNLPLVNDPGDLGLAFEEDGVPNVLGEQLRVWYIPAAAERGVVVVSNGSSGAMQCYLHAAWLLTQMGWTVIMYDYTGFGASSGTASLHTLIPDLTAVTEWAVVRSGRSQVTLLGVSLGTIPSVAVAAERPEWVNAVVLDSPVALGDQIERFGVPLRLPVDEILTSLDPALITERTVFRVRQPLIVFLHGHDRVTTPPQVRKIFARAPGVKELVEFAGLPHAMGQYLATEQYVNRLEPFLAEVWGVPPVTWRSTPTWSAHAADQSARRS